VSRFSVIVLSLLLAGAATAETITVNSVGHYLRLNDPDMIELEDDYEA